MARVAEQKLKILYLLKILTEKSDEDHPLGIKDIQKFLQDYGITAERKSLYDDITQLQIYGIDIIKVKNTNFGYYIASRDFQLPELKLLVDAVQCAKFITPKKTNELIRKIENLASVYQASQLQRQVYVANRVKTLNEQIYISTDILHTAILRNQKIKFKYFEWIVDFNDTELIKKRLRRQGEYYEMSPWAMTWEDENYYLIAYDSDEKLTKHFRVDKMSRIELINEERDGEEQFKNFDIAKYCKKSFGMYGGTEENVKIVFDNKLIGVVADRFGKEIFITKADDSHFSVILSVEISPVFISWILSFGTDAKVVAPENVKDIIKNHVMSIAGLYK